MKLLTTLAIALLLANGIGNSENDLSLTGGGEKGCVLAATGGTERGINAEIGGFEKGLAFSKGGTSSGGVNTTLYASKGGGFERRTKGGTSSGGRNYTA